jgi:hypothetical protein
VGNKFVIYESGQPQHSTGVTYAAGDYMKVVRSGTTIKYYHIKASEGVLAKGLLLPTFAKTTSSSSVNVILISLPSVNTPLRFTAPSICQASAVGDTAGNSIDFGDISKGLDISPSSQNLALSSKGLATISTNVTHWYANGTAKVPNNYHYIYAYLII